MEKVLRTLGIKIGHYTDRENITGSTCFMFDHGAALGIDIRGSNTGTVNIPAYSAKSVNEKVRAVVLTGGSTMGLATCFGIMRQLKDSAVVGAVIYDLSVGKMVFPGEAEGLQMAQNAAYDCLEQGCVGVGTGATSGKWQLGRKLKGGFGYAYKEIVEGIYIAAFVVTNPGGDVIHPEKNQFYAEVGGHCQGLASGFLRLPQGGNTTLGLIATNAVFDREALSKIAELGHDAFARGIYPVHTMGDGDVIFAVSTAGEETQVLHEERNAAIMFAGIHAEHVMGEAIKNSMRYATGIEGFPACRDLILDI